MNVLLVIKCVSIKIIQCTLSLNAYKYPSVNVLYLIYFEQSIINAMQRL